MVYLYAGLGIAMLSGIMAIFEMGLAVTGQSLFEIESRYHDSNYFKNPSSSVRSGDINLIQKLSNGTWRKEYLAENPGSQPTCSDLSVLYAPGTIWNRVSPEEIDSPCESYGDGRRIVVDIVADEVLYLCIPKQDLGKCFFEEKSYI